MTKNQLLIELVEHTIAMVRPTYPQLANALSEALNNATSRVTTDSRVGGYAPARVEQQFKPALDKLVRLGDRISVDHTGGGVYVMYYIWDDESTQRVGITPEEEDDTWLVVGYIDRDDEGRFINHNVKTEALYWEVMNVRDKVLKAATTLAPSYDIPGTFSVEFGREEDDVTFRWCPAAASAGYFGAHAYETESGDPLPERLEDRFWEVLAAKLQDQGESFKAIWEG